MIPADQPALRADNLGYRYGNGLFETMKVFNRKILLESYHFDRLFQGMHLLKYTVPAHLTPQRLKAEVLELCERNECEGLGRVRLSISPGHGGLFDSDQSLQYLIECWPLPASANQLNENGLIIDIFPDAQKSNDIYSNLKSANFLPYAMAAQYAKSQQLNECLVLNTEGNIADATIANVFIIKDEFLYTPSLKDGCVNGVMRRYLLEKFQDHGYRAEEMHLSPAMLLDADEVFLTNAINGIRWVRQFRNKEYGHQATKEIYTGLIQTFFS